MTYEEIVEKVARSWASIDGRLEDFEKGKADPKYDYENGYYMGYIEEAKELLKRSDLETMLKVVSKVLTHLNAEKNGVYFICGEGGTKNEIGLPERIHVCATYGLDWFTEYQRTDKTVGPEW